MPCAELADEQTRLHAVWGVRWDCSTLQLLEASSTRRSRTYNPPMSRGNWLERLGRRWDSRQEAANNVERHAFEASVVIAADVEAVWEFVTQPASNSDLEQGFVKTFPVPATPTFGVGHQYCNVHENQAGGQTVLLTEIEEVDRPRRLKRRVLNGRGDLVRILTLEKVEAGCLYTVRTEVTVPTAGVELARHVVEGKMQQTLLKVKQVVESGSHSGPARRPPRD